MKHSNEKILEIVDHINRGLLDREVAEKMGVSLAYVWGIRNGKERTTVTKGLLRPPKILRSNRKIAPEVYPLIEMDINSGMTYMETAKKYGASYRTISNIYNRTEKFICRNWDKVEKCASFAGQTAVR